VLDVDRDRQRISLGLKQTQTDPWQKVIDECSQNDVVTGRITKVVTFGAFAEIVSGVEGLIHISELAEHHVENPREVVNQGDAVNVKIIEIDAERRRLSLSLRRVEPGEPVKTIDLGLAGASVSTVPVPELGSDEVFADDVSDENEDVDAEVAEVTADAEVEPEVAVDPEAEVEAEPEAAVEEAVAEEAQADEAEAEEAEAEVEAESTVDEDAEATAEEPAAVEE